MELHVRKSYGEEIQLREILDPRQVTFVAESAGELQAYAQLGWQAAPTAVSGERPIEIRRFYVDAHWHGRGLAQRLMAKVLEFAVSSAADTVWLGVWEQNPRGIAFYAKCGFTPVGHHTFVVGNDPQRDVLMARSADRA